MKEIIETLIERGWESPIVKKADLIWNDVTQKYIIDIRLSAKVSLADIINDKEAMRLLFGEVDMDKVDPGSAYLIIDYRWHQQQLIIMDSEQDQIKYILEHYENQTTNH